METENQNTEGAKDSTSKTGGDQTEWMKGDLGKIISMLNQPGIASALASVGLYFAIDPKAIKNGLEEVQQSNMQIIEKMNELIEETVKIKKQLKKLASREDEAELEEGQMNGYRKVHKRHSSIHLD